MGQDVSTYEGDSSVFSESKYVVLMSICFADYYGESMNVFDPEPLDKNPTSVTNPRHSTASIGSDSSEFSMVANPSTITDPSNSQHQDDTAIDAVPPKCHLDTLPHDVLFHLLQHVPPLSLHTFSATCRSVHRFIEANMDALYRHYTTSHFGLSNPCLTYYHTKRLAHESIQEQTWLDMYWRLTVCKTRWIGWAMDRATEDFNPYAMELIIRDVRASPLRTSEMKVNGVCRWRAIGDALTSVRGTLKIPEHHSRNPSPFAFEEHCLLRGPNTIALPNTYVGLVWGSVMIGTYDPGALPSMCGTFGLVMEERVGDDVPELDSRPVFSPQSATRADCLLYSGVMTHVAMKTCQSIKLIVEESKASGTLYLVDVGIVVPFNIHPSGESLILHKPAVDNDTAEWWLPDVLRGNIALKRMGNGIMGLFREPHVGIFYITPYA
ncbi:hypothetical protein DFS34DRAFT_597374 [Phlyctochytrium arcticum]|nr:hypothetical protein DFS34DRAFT_597374 [Phlyctochytrium arcticum]